MPHKRVLGKPDHEKKRRRVSTNAYENVRRKRLRLAHSGFYETTTHSGEQANGIGTRRPNRHRASSTNVKKPRSTTGRAAALALPVKKKGLRLEKILDEGHTASDNKRKRGISFRALICIMEPHDEKGKLARWTIASLDTQSKYNIMFKSEAEKLGLKWVCIPGSYRGLGREEIKSIGRISIWFSFEDQPEQQYMAVVDILEDAFSESEGAPFSILIGSEVITRENLLVVNKDKVPRVFPTKRVLST